MGKLKAKPKKKTRAARSKAKGYYGKFGAQKTEIDGIIFDSKLEAQRYVALKILEADGYVASLERQPQYVIDVNGVHICNYKADFSYIQEGKKIVEDVKGFVQDRFSIVKKLMKAVHNIEIQIWPPRKRKIRKDKGKKKV